MFIQISSRNTFPRSLRPPKTEPLGKIFFPPEGLGEPVLRHLANVESPRAAIRQRSRYSHHGAQFVRARRSPPGRGLFGCDHFVTGPEEDLWLAGWLLVVVAVLTMLDLLAIFLMPLLTLPIYTLVVAGCVLVLILALESERNANDVRKSDLT